MVNNLYTLLFLPQVPLKDWTVAVLFSRVSSDVIVKCINLLLLEQSLVIIGEDLGLVSAIGTALISLLKPFKWDGVFIPVLPSGLSDILQSPVPFVLGCQPPFDPSTATPHAAALHIGKYKEHLRLPGMETKLPLCYQLLQELHDAAKVFSCRRSRWANLHLSTYMSGLTSDETQALGALEKIFQVSIYLLRYFVREDFCPADLHAFLSHPYPFPFPLLFFYTIQRYVENLCGDLKYNNAWRKYGAFNSTTHDFEFFPCWFLAPLQMMLDFQSAMVHTQMFHSYIEKRRYVCTCIGDVFENTSIFVCLITSFSLQGGGSAGAATPSALPVLHCSVAGVPFQAMETTTTTARWTGGSRTACTAAK